jgi:uroporphyrin-III C-methyltransferase/precorrin-2 dehydrogenase/sirohydrochlorin ferrochelatase
MGELARLPIFLALRGKRAVVAGGTPGAAWKAELLSAAGAAVDVYTGAPSDELIHVAENALPGAIVIRPRGWRPEDLSGAAIAIGAFDDDEEARAFADAARCSGVPVNVIDKPAFSDFAFGSIVNRSPLVIGISTDGAAPIFAQAIRAKLEALLPKGFADWAAVAARWRPAVKASGLSFAGRRKFWQLFTERAVTHPDHKPSNAELDRMIADVGHLGPKVDSGSVTLVGAGPGDPELLTLRAVRALQAADVILFDDLVSREVLDFARREARKMLVGKTGHGPSCRQEDINALMVGLAKSGKRVVRLKGGDPMIFGRASEEIAACRAAGISVEVVPGITAAQGAASRLGVSLTERGHARRIQYVTGHGKDGTLPQDLDLASIADTATTTAIYKPTSTIKLLVEKARAAGLDPATPAVAVIRATQPDEVVRSGRIDEIAETLAQAAPDGPVLVMLGRVFAGRDAHDAAADLDHGTAVARG